MTNERLCLSASVNSISAKRVDAGDGVFRAFDGPGLARLRRARSVRGGFSARRGGGACVVARPRRPT